MAIRDKLLEAIVPIVTQRPLLYSVPITTVNNYTDRHVLAYQINEKLNVIQSNCQVPHALVIHGLGGTGKSQLALKYAEDHKKEYSPILWIDAKNEGSTRSSFERCAAELRLQIDRVDSRTSTLTDSPVVAAVCRWLRERTDSDDEWLTIIDNADDLSWGVKWVLPDGPRGRILITSQDRKALDLVKGPCEEMSIGVMDVSQTRTLLLNHLGIGLDRASQDILDGCDKIAEQLGYLPLAVDLAGAYMAHDDPDPRAAVQHYLKYYSNHQEDLLRSKHHHGLSPNEKTVWTAWDTTLERIEKDYPEAGMFIGWLARFRGGIIQEELFRLASLGIKLVKDELFSKTELPLWLARLLEIEGQEWQIFHYRYLRNVFVRYSLLQEVGGEWPGVTMHNLVRWRATRNNQTWPWDSWYLRFITASGAELARQRARPHFRRHFIAHMPVLKSEYLDKAKVLREELPLVWQTFAEIYDREGRWKEAEELEIQVMEMSKRVLGVEHPDTLTSMANLAHTYKAIGCKDKAVQLMKTVVDLRKKIIGLDHPHTEASAATLTLWMQP